MTNINHKNIEQWIFEYSEGNLNNDEQKKFIKFVESHAEYKDDLNLWGLSYIKAPLPTISFENLERKPPEIKLKTKFIKFGIIASILIVATMLYIFNSTITSKKKSFSMHKKVVSTKSNISIENKNLKIVSVVKVISGLNIKKNSVKNVLPITYIKSFKMDVDSLISMPLPIVKHVKSDSILGHVNKANKSEEVKSLTKSELRKIQKFKAQINQRRQEQEFMKGGIPYVVPMEGGF